MEKAGIKEIMAYFGTKERPVTPPEFRSFWQELSDAEKDFYKVEIGKIMFVAGVVGADKILSS